MQPNPLPLRDIHLPEAIGWWPPALGWWLLAIMLLLLTGLAIWLFKRLTRKSAVKTAKKLLAAIKQDKTLDNLQKLRELSALVRRVAVSVAPRAEVAGLTGQAWLAFLDASLKNSPFSAGVGQLLVDAPYRKVPPAESEISQLIHLCEDWLDACGKGAREKP